MTGDFDKVMKLLYKADRIGIRIINPTEDDIDTINELYDKRIVPEKSCSISFGVPITKVNVYFEFQETLGDLESKEK